MSFTPITAAQVLEVWGDWQGMRDAMQKRDDYYHGRHGILQESATRDSDKAKRARIVTNWVRFIVDSHVGFLTSRPIEFLSRDGSGEVEVARLIALRDKNNLRRENTDLLRHGVLYGYGVEVHSFSEEGGIRIRHYDPRNWAFVLDTVEGEERIHTAIYRVELPVGTVHDGVYLEEPVYVWTVYDAETIRVYKGRGSGGLSVAGTSVASSAGLVVDGDLELVSSNTHAYGRVPVIRYPVNEWYISHITDALISQQDAYNRTRSENNDDVSYNVDQFLALIGFSAERMLKEDPESGKTQVDLMRELRILFLDDAGDAKFLEKGNSVEKVTAELDLARDAIHMMGGVPDVAGRIIGVTGATSGIALKLMFQGQQQNTETFMKYFIPALRERVDLINRVWVTMGMSPLTDYDVSFNLNIPANETELMQNIPFLKQLLENKEVARLMPFIEDAQTVQLAENVPVLEVGVAK